MGGGGFGLEVVRVDMNEELMFLRQFTQKNRLGRGGGGFGLGGQGGCEQRIEVFVKIQKKMGGEGVRLDVNEELKFL